MGSFSLLPKQEKFYIYLTDLATKANTCAHHLKSYIEAPDASSRERIDQEITTCRTESKAIMGELTGALCRSFITPFDREDIQLFAQYLYKIPKYILKVIQRIELHGIEDTKEDLITQINLIIEESTVMEDMVHDLVVKRNTNQVVEQVKQLHRLEQKGDDVFQELLASLFAGDRTVKDLILRKDIYDLLEKVIDCYRDVAGVALQIVLKYS
jgi:uncharacterized protein Yka (UPF0111/DUF47 family)